MKSSLKFIDYIVDEINFKNNYTELEEIEIDFDIDTEIKFKEDNRFILKLNLKLFDKAEVKQIAPFFMNVKVVGLFEVEGCDEELKRGFAEVNSIAILFPYVRALVSNYTAMANVSSLILPPINVIEYLKEKDSR